MIPLAIRFAILIDLALNAIAAVFGPDHIMIVRQPIGQFGVLVTAGIVLHETMTAGIKALRDLQRWWKRRSRRSPGPTEQ